MVRKILIGVALLALMVTGLVPITASAEQSDAGPAVAGPEVRESTTGSYIVVMAAEPLLADLSQDQLRSSDAKEMAQSMAAGQTQALNEAGVSADQLINSYTNALNGFSAVMSYEQAKAVAALDSVYRVLPDEMRYIDTDSSSAFLGLSQPGGAWSTGRTGEDVVVGIIDTGIWPEHPSFADDGSFSDLGLAVPCDFGNTAQNPLDAPFTCQNKLIGARQTLETYRVVIGADPDEYDSARDDDGHGTHTASTAAGNANVTASMYGRRVGTVSGIAPRARVVAYKGLGNLGGFTSDLTAAIDMAVADGVDVINYSIGGGAGIPSTDDIAFLFAADAGVFVATSAGNSGPDPETVGGPGHMPWMTTVGASTQSRFFQGTITLGNGAQYPGASITRGAAPSNLVDAEFAGGDLCVPGTLDAAMVAGNIVLCQRGSIGRAEKSLAVFQAGGTGMILYNQTDDDNLFTDTHWVPSVHIDNAPGLQIKAYIAGSDGPTARIITRQRSNWEAAPSMTIFSSRGPNPISPDIIKPDITAPGLQILAGNSPTPDPDAVQGELFQAIAGTSMSSPHIAGLFALLKQDHPDWTPAMARSALMTTSYQEVVDNDRITPADAFSMGAGHADPGKPMRRGSSFQPGLVYDAGLLEYAAYTCGADFEVFTPESCDFVEDEGFPSDASDLNLPSIGIADLAGSQTVTRTVTSVAKEVVDRVYDVSVVAPPGYDVTVSPTRIRLATGETATYTVTITNVSGPIGEWAQGSLTWTTRSGDYVVYSPIAVKGALIGVPGVISGAGDIGSASFDVDFGYTGDYTAAAHGLEAATVTSDNVLQDPDQTFDPSDVGAGGANLHQFTLSGSALFRIAMPPEATEADADLDIFVYDPAGNFVAASTAGGTSELINLDLPADGVWSVYVHGWSAPGGDSDYDLFTWDISATPGGNLTIDNAPASAVLSTTGTIDVSWTGATLGEWHLGAVSHSDGSGLLDLTLVEVDNRAG